ncbi:hypothetical protein H4R26_000716, partial [Coemansia thaxteri]
MTSLIDAVGECLVRLEAGNHDGSLAVVDRYLNQVSSGADSDTGLADDSQPESEAKPSSLGLHPHGLPIERRAAALLSDDNCSDSSSFSDVASFRDASSSPFWQDTPRFPFRLADNEHDNDVTAGHVPSYTAEGVLGHLRQLVQREIAWKREKADYESYLAQMALQLEQQAQMLKAAADSFAAPATQTEASALHTAASVAASAASADAGRSAEPQPAAEDVAGTALPSTPNWWSTFLPSSTTVAATAADTSRGIASGYSNWSPPAMTLPYSSTAGFAYMAPPTLSVGDSRYPTPIPACAVVSTTGEEVCLECIQACERVAESVLNGDFSARVRCTRCHTLTANDGETSDDDEDSEWPMLPKSRASASNRKPPSSARTPLIKRPVTHTQRLANRVNRMASLLASVTHEIVEVALNDGTRGFLGTQGDVDGLKGTWLDLMNEVNMLTKIHTEQVRNIAHVCNSVANGNLTEKVTVDVNGEMLDLKTTINGMVEQLGAFSMEVTRVTHAVGTEGILGVGADVPGVNGVWKQLTDNVNNMANNLTYQVRDISKVCRAVASGDLTQEIEVEARGEMLDLKTTINNMVTSLDTMAHEVSRVAVEVGIDGMLGGQAFVRGLEGTWKHLTDNVNQMADNLTRQVRDISQVTQSVAAGDLTQKVTSELNGEMGELKATINTMVDQLSTFASEVSRVAKEVGTEGKLGGQAHVPNVDGVWKDLTRNVNNMASNLTNQVRDIANVTKAICVGDLNQKVTSELNGEMGELKTTINTMVDQLSHFADEVTRVAVEVGIQGRLGAQARVLGVEGVWKDLTFNVNRMANNITRQVRTISEVTASVADGDLGKIVDIPCHGEMEFLKNTINEMVGRLKTFSSEVSRVAKEVGTDGQLGGQAVVPDVEGIWKALTGNVNNMAANLTNQVRDIANVTKAVAAGDLTQKVEVPLNGEMGELKSTINTMVDQLSTFASEVSRVAKEVGTDGILGGQANVEGVDGTWKDLTDNVNKMADNLTNQVRDIADVTKAVAAGDLKRKVQVPLNGEMGELKTTINTMVDQLSTFADEVSRVAKEVGTDGQLGGQANVDGVDGTWKDLTDNVNKMADNLTNQVRDIADVTKAVAAGDLKRK